MVAKCFDELVKGLSKHKLIYKIGTALRPLVLPDRILFEQKYFARSGLDCVTKFDKLPVIAEGLQNQIEKELFHSQLGSSPKLIFTLGAREGRLFPTQHLRPSLFAIDNVSELGQQLLAVRVRKRR